MATARTAERNDTSSGQMYVCTDSGVSEINGVPVPYVKGKTLIREGNPLLEVAGHSFRPADERIDYGVEAATQGPGEKRGRQS